jgi:hypothetical protein
LVEVGSYKSFATAGSRIPAGGGGIPIGAQPCAVWYLCAHHSSWPTGCAATANRNGSDESTKGPHVVGAHVYGWAGYSGQTPNGADGPVNRCGMSFGRYWYSNSSPAHACLPRAYSVWTAQSVSTRSLVRISQERLHPQAVASHLGNSRAWVPDELACKSQQRPQPAARCRRTPHMRFTKA